MMGTRDVGDMVIDNSRPDLAASRELLTRPIGYETDNLRPGNNATFANR
jgi:hypothetical protein